MEFKELKQTLENNGAVVKLMEDHIRVQFRDDEDTYFSLMNVYATDIMLEVSSSSKFLGLDVTDIKAIKDFMTTKPEYRFYTDKYRVVIGAVGMSREGLDLGDDQIYMAYTKTKKAGFGRLQWCSANDLKEDKFNFNKSELEDLYTDLSYYQGEKLAKLAEDATEKVEEETMEAW